jgi:hypothetical protein
MNGKLKRQLIKFYNGVIELRDKNEDFRNFTFNSDKYFQKTIEIFNSNNVTSEIVEAFNNTTIIKKFRDNIYLTGTVDRYHDWYLRGSLKLYRIKGEDICEIVSIENLFEKPLRFYVNVEKELILSCTGVLKEEDIEQKIYRRIRDEKILYHLICLSNKMVEMAKDAQDEICEILVKLREENCLQTLKKIIENKEEE